jgi:hypothetical protein
VTEGRADRSATSTTFALVVYAVFAALTVVAGLPKQRPLALVALLLIPALAAVRGRPAAFATLVVLGGLVLRVAYYEAGVADQIRVAQAAFEVAAGGGNPYGRAYAESVPPGASYPYGPLGLVWWAPGIAVELAASVATLVLLAVARAWTTLAVCATWIPFAMYSVYGINDSSPGLFITAGLLALPGRPILSGVLLAVAGALKPYAFAWFPGAVAVGGLRTLVALAAVTALLWSPLIVWRPRAFLRSVEIAEGLRALPPNALNAPVLRVLAVPIALAALLVRRWDFAVLSGAAIFVIVLFSARWASPGYWVAVLPIVGVAIEQVLLPRLVARRTREESC